MLSFQAGAQWESGAPVSFQNFLNLNFGLDTAHSLKCRSTLCSPKITNLFRQYERDQITVTMYPNWQKPQCTVLLLVNMAEPDLISVKCDTKIMFDVFCETRKYSNVIPFVQQISLRSRKYHAIPWKRQKKGRDQSKTRMILGETDKKKLTSTDNDMDTFVEACLLRDSIVGEKRCLVFSWFKTLEQMASVCKPMNIFRFANLTDFENVIQPISVRLPPLITLIKNQTMLKIFRYEKHMHHVWQEVDNVKNPNVTGLQVCVSNMRKLELGEHLFKCAVNWEPLQWARRLSS